MEMSLDLAILIGYIIFMFIVSYLLKRSVKNTTSEFFRGSGKMVWWMVGTTAFMTQFSAWTFTGAASKAYFDGFSVVYIFIGNVTGFAINAWLTAQRFRRLDVVTPMEAVRMRFGKFNEQLFTWTSFPNGIVGASIWLSALSSFAAAVLKIDPNIIVMAVGGVVLMTALTGGAKSILAVNFIQMLIILTVATVTTVYALMAGGGLPQIIHNFPRDFAHGDSVHSIALFSMWALIMVIRQVLGTNNISSAYRFLSAKDIVNARRAAILASLLMVIGIFIWFIPPWTSAYLFPNLLELYSNLGEKADNAAYLVFVQHAMPAGMTGVLMAALFAATMSPLSSRLNANAAMFTRSCYIHIRPKSSETELMLAARISTVFFAIIIVLGGMFINNLKGISLFQVMQYFSALLTLPTIIPLLYGLFLRKLPQWSPLATIIFGFSLSYFVTTLDYDSIMGRHLNNREHSDLLQIVGIVSQMVLTGGFMYLTGFFHDNKIDNAYNRSSRKFFLKLEGHHIPDDLKDELDNEEVADDLSIIGNLQRHLLISKLVIVMSFLFLLLIIIPQGTLKFFTNTQAHLAFVLCFVILFTVGMVIFKTAKKHIAEFYEAHPDMPKN